MSKFRSGDIVIVQGKVGIIVGAFFSWDIHASDTIMYTIDIQGEILYKIENEIKLWNNKQTYKDKET